MGEGDDEALVAGAVEDACAVLRDLAARMAEAGDEPRGERAA